MRKICSIVHLVVIVAVAAVFFVAGGGALCRAEGAAQNSATPLLSGGNPDPTVCRVGDEYYIVTSSFSLSPGLPVYRSKDMVNWEVISHAWRESWPCKTPDDGIWAPTLRHHNGVFYLTVTWHDGFKKAENYLLTARDPAGPWSKPMKIEAKTGIDGSLFFDGDDAWYLSNMQPAKQRWRGHCQIWMQRIDLATGRLFGEEHVLTDGFGGAPAFAEGPHLYKIGGRYLLLHAQGGTAWGHTEIALVSDCVTGPYVHVAGNPVLTAKDRGRNSPLQAFGHADLVQMPDGEWRAVFLGMRMTEGGAKCPLGRETFSCRVGLDGDGLPTRFRRDELIAGDWNDPAATRYSLLDRPGDPVRYVKVRNLAARVDYPDKPFRFCAALAAVAPRRAVGQSLSLDGTWRFSFQGGEERDMPVPSCWELQVVGTLRYGEADAKESGRYSRTFAIPSDWPAALRGDGTGVALIPDGGTGDVAFENVGGRIRISHNAALRKGFANPPPDVKIGCYYYWVNERVDEEGVKKDLQWMKENGITRAFLATDIRNRTRFENPWEGQQFGDCAFRSEKWWRCLRTAFRTAGELGIEMGIFNCPGWSQSGGPWVTKEDAQIAPDGTYPENGPCSPVATGYEIDKTNRAAVRRHFDAFVGDILRRIPPAERPTLTTVVVDSWERGRVVKPAGDPRKLSDIIAEEYMGELTRCAHENGLITWCEPYSHSRGGWDGDSATYGAAADEVSAEFWAGEPKNERAKEIKAALGAARLGGKNKIYAESFTAGSWTEHAKDDWSFASLKPYADKFFRKGVNATILHVVISQPGDETEPPVRTWFGTFFDRRSKNAAEMKKLVPYLRRCNFMLQQGRPADGRTDTRILPDGTRIRFTEQSLFEVVFPDGRTETWNPVSGKIGI